MRKLKLLLAGCALFGVSATWAQEWTDVTNTYITNASLVSDYYSSSNNTAWPVYTTGRTGNTQHPKNWYLHTNGTTNHNIDTGTGFFECWAANQGVKRWTLFQDITLPAGTYRLTGQYSTNENRGIIKTVAITPHHSYFSPGITSGNWGNWGSETTEFTIYEETKVRVGMIATNFAQNHGFTLTTTGAKQLLADVIAAAPVGVSTTDAQTVYEDGSSDDAAYRSAAKTLHDAIVTYNIENASAGAPVDMTDYITNPSFEGVGGTVLTADASSCEGWTTPNASDKGAKSATSNSYLITDNSEDGFYIANYWNSGSFSYYIKQTLSSLPAGRYQLTARYASDASNTASLYMGATTNSTTITATDKGHFVEGNVVYDLETDGDVEIGITSEKWMKADGFKLLYLGDPLKAVKAELLALLATIDGTYLEAATYANIVGTERTNLTSAKSTTAASETVEAYETAISSVQAAIDAFTAAKTNYDANAAEVTKATALGVASGTISSYTAGASTTSATALTNTQNLKVAEYNYVTTNYAYGVTLGEWTSSGSNAGKDFNNEHWSGTKTNYKNQNDDGSQGWNSSAWDMDYNQNVTLPAGNYVFKVAARQAASDKITTSLIVKNGETVLGSVDDFPRNGSTARGIDKTGATKFEGEDSEFAHDGAGYGWEWRYVKFTLASDATVNIAVKAVATDYHQWVSFGDYTLQTDNEANISLIAYNIALNDATTARDNAAYTNVTGSEKTTLLAAIAADASLDKSDKDKIDDATTALTDATSAFTAAKSAYDTFVAAKAVEYEDNLPYASSSKFADIGTAQAATATSASEATAKTAAIISAYRKYVESNALAEGVVGAENKTNLIADPDMDVTYDSENHTFGAWQVFSQVDGTISLKTESDEPMTDSDGNKYKYADIWKSDNNGGIKQTLSNLPAGKYLLTVASRAQNTAGATFVLFAGDKNTPITRMNNTGGVFGNGWNDASLMFFVTETRDVEIGVVSGNGKTMWWGATRFRLVRLGDAVEPVSITAAGLATYVSNVALDFEGMAVKAYTASLTGEEGNKTVLLTRVNKVPANTGLVLKGAEGSYNIPVIASADAIDGNLMEGTLTETAVAASTDGSYNYMLSNGANGVGFYNVASATTSAAGKAYLHSTVALKDESGAGSRLSIIFSDEEPTGIAEIGKTKLANDGKVYNLSGQQVSKPSKGLYIVNGKKVSIK